MQSKGYPLLRLHTDNGEVVYLDKHTHYLESLLKENLDQENIDIILPECSTVGVQNIASLVKFGATIVSLQDVGSLISVGKIFLGVDISSLWEEEGQCRGSVKFSENKVLKCKKFICKDSDKEELFQVCMEDILDREVVATHLYEELLNIYHGSCETVEDDTWVVDESQTLYNCNTEWRDIDQINDAISTKEASVNVATGQYDEVVEENEPENTKRKDEFSHLKLIGYDEKISQTIAKGRCKTNWSKYNKIESLECEHCGKIMNSKSHLRTHNVQQHGKENNMKSYCCNLCELVFYRNYDLRLHQRRKHENEKPNICHICAKGFFRGYDLKKHQRLVHEKQKPCICDTCGKGFAQNHHLNVHKIIHTGERMFPCKEEECEMSFKQKWHLVQHERLHSGVKPYQCNFCKVGFPQKSSLDSHVKIHNK